MTIDQANAGMPKYTGWCDSNNLLSIITLTTDPSDDYQRHRDTDTQTFKHRHAQTHWVMRLELFAQYLN